MRHSLKAAQLAVLLAASLACVSPAFGAGVKATSADTSIVLQDLTPNEGYSGGYTTQSVPETPGMDIAELDADLNPNEGYHGGYSHQVTPDTSIVEASDLNSDLSPNEGYAGGYSVQIIREASSRGMSQAKAVRPSKSLHGSAGE